MALWIVGAFVAFFVKGVCGFANTLVFDSILSFGVANSVISPVELIIGFPANIIMALKNKKFVNIKLVILFATLILIGSIPAAFLLKNVNPQIIKIIFGVVVVFLGIDMLYREINNKKNKPNILVVLPIGIVAGVICGLYGVGVLLAAYVNRLSDSVDEFKGTLSAIFVIENIFRIITYILAGLITIQTIEYVAMLLPVMLVALFVGMKIGSIINERIAKFIVIVLLIISGISLVVTNI